MALTIQWMRQKHRDKILYAEKHNPRRMLKLGQRVLSGSASSELQQIVNQMDRCSPRWRCHLPYCPQCGVSEVSKKRLEKAGKIPEGSVCSEPNRSPRSKTRVAVRALFGHLPENNMGCITIHFSAARNAVDAESMIDLYRKQLRSFLTSKIPDSTVWLAFEVVSRQAKDVDSNIYPDRRWKHEYDPGETIWLIHCHGLIYAPNMTPSEIRVAFKTRKNGKRSRYAGSRQVDVRPVEHLFNESGTDVKGIEGFAEYAVKMHFEPIEYAQNTSLYVDWVLLTSRLRKKNKHLFRFGTKKNTNVSPAPSPPSESFINVLSALSVNIWSITNSALVTHCSNVEKHINMPRPVQVSEKSHLLLDHPSNRGPPIIISVFWTDSNAILSCHSYQTAPNIVQSVFACFDPTKNG